MPNHEYLNHPYVPNCQNKRQGRPTHRNYLHRIAYTETVRDYDSDKKVLLFHAPFALVKDVCQKVFTMLQGNVGNIIVKNEHSCRVKNGKCYWRVAVEIIGLNENIVSFTEFVLMMISCMRRTANCTIRHYRTETFLNL